MKKISGRYYGYWTDKNRRPKEKSYPLGTRLKSAATLRFHELDKRFADPKDPFDPWVPGSDARPEERHVTFQQAKELFLESRSHLKPLTIRTYGDVLRWFGEKLPPNLMLRDLDAARLKRFVHDPKQSRASQRKRYTNLRAFFRWCTGEGGLLQESPLESVPQPKPEKKLPEYLTPEELERLLTAIEVDYEMKSKARRAYGSQILWLKDAVVLAVSTGMRRGELLSLRWQGVDFERGVIYVRHAEGFSTKGGSERPIPMVKPAREVLEKLAAEARERQGERSGAVLRGQRGGSLNGNLFTRRFKYYVRLAKLDERFSVHSLRHTTASWLLQKGYSLEVVGAILGHTDVRTTRIYAHLAQDTLMKAMLDTFGE